MFSTSKNRFAIPLTAVDFASFAAYAGYAAGTAAIPVILLQMSKTLNFSIASGGALHLLRSSVMLLTMLAAGSAAYRFGKIRMLGVALLLMAAGLQISGAAGSFAFLLAGVAVTGLGNGFFESLLTSSVEDRHPEPSETSRCINLTHSFWSFGVVAMGLCAGYMLQKGVSWRLILSGIALFLTVPAVLFLIFSNKTFSRKQISVKQEMAGLLKERRFRCFLLALFLAGGAEHCLTFWMPGFMKLTLGADDVVCGVAAGYFAGGMFCGRFFSGIFCRKNLSGLILLCTLTGTVLSVLVPLAESAYCVMVLLFILGVAAGPLWPSLQFCCARMMRRKDNTAVYVLMPLVGIPGCGFFTWLMGVISEYCGMKTGFFLVPLCNCGILMIMLIIGKLKKKESGEL